MKLTTDHRRFRSRDLKETWQSFLTSTDFYANIDKQYLFKVNQYGLNMTMVIDGMLQPNLLRAMVAVYRDDLETLIQLAPGAIRGANRQDLYKNMNAVYDCLIQFSIRPQVAGECTNIKDLVTLDTAQFERLKSSYSRLTRLSHFEFTHRYCEFRLILFYKTCTNPFEP